MITLLFFAYLKEQIGHDSLTLDADALSVYDIKQHLTDTYGLDCLSLMAAVNEVYAPDTQLVHRGDTMTLIPPVSGGR